MKITSLLSRVLPFVFTFACGVLIAYLLAPIGVLTMKVAAPDSSSHQGSGSAACSGSSSGLNAEPAIEVRKGTNPLRITAKPKAGYTDDARANNVEGAVRLKVTLLANGQVGSITVVDGLPDGLTEQAIAAARRLKFEPATKDGVAVSKIITIDYSFTIY